MTDQELILFSQGYKNSYAVIKAAHDYLPEEHRTEKVMKVILNLTVASGMHPLRIINNIIPILK